jgi:GNAT superfamily N-acetyltransferase
VHDASIRELEPERDAKAVVALIRESDPHIVISVESWLHRFRTVPERAEQGVWVAELDGRVAGYAFGFKNFFTKGSTSVFGRVLVGEPHRRRGIGTALHDRLVEHADALSAGSILTHFLESPAGVAFATTLGYREARAEQESVLDPRTISEVPPPGLELRTISNADPRDVYDVDLAATRDVPLTEPVDDIPYDEWEDHVLGHPHFTGEGSFLAYVDGEPAAVSMLVVDLENGRAANMFTGTLPRFRGRGLGLAVKLASIAWAKEHGITSMATTNDERNAPMLAINRRLGYVPAGRHVEYVREAETASSPAPPAPAT